MNRPATGTWLEKTGTKRFPKSSFLQQKVARKEDTGEASHFFGVVDFTWSADRVNAIRGV